MVPHEGASECVGKLEVMVDLRGLLDKRDNKRYLVCGDMVEFGV